MACKPLTELLIVIGHEILDDPPGAHESGEGIENAAAILKPAVTDLTGLGTLHLVGQVAVTDVLDLNPVSR